MSDSFELNSDEHDSVYRDTVQPYAFAGTTPSMQPVIIIIGAQPGAGKTKVVDRSIDALDGNAVKINVDDLRRFHPQKDEIRELDDKLYAARTQQDASAWADRLLEQAAKDKRNIVLETAMRNPDRIHEIAQTFKDLGYEVQLCLVATHRKISAVSVYDRYERRKSSEKRYGRWISHELQEQSFLGVRESLERIEDDRLADRIKVFDCNGNVLFENSLLNGSWKTRSSATEALDSERNRALSSEEQEAYKEAWLRVFHYLSKRNATESEFAEARRRHESHEERQRPCRYSCEQ